MNSKFEQRAGAHSHQIVNIGLSATDALQIVDNRIKAEFEGLREESARQITDRLEKFGDRLVADLAKVGRLDMAAEPNLWTAIQAAAREAAVTETESDIDFLIDQHSIRINDQWRICFVRTPAGPGDVEITDHHSEAT